MNRRYVGVVVLGEAKRKAAAREKSAAEIERSFVRQWNFLVSSCLAYDAGSEWELVRIAGAVATFCNDGTSPSLLTLMDYGRFYQGRLLDTAGDVGDTNLLDDHPLVGFSMGIQGSAITHFLDDIPPDGWLKFGKWWNGTVVRFASTGQKYNRKQLILALRNTDGYGHVTRKADPLIDEIGEDAPARWQAFKDGQPEKIKGDILSSSVRQIGHELVRSLEKHVPSLVVNGIEYPAHLSIVARNV